MIDVKKETPLDRGRAGWALTSRHIALAVPASFHTLQSDASAPVSIQEEPQ